MKRLQILFVGLTVLSFAIVQMAPAQTDRYVDKANASPSSPYTSWTDAATNIQDAISACSSGDVVWVTNGVYDTGGVTNWPADTVITNRVAITNAITVRSFNNDPSKTIIKGESPIGLAAVRCVFMTNGSSLIGFMLTNGATLLINTPEPATTNDNHHGAGVYCLYTTTPYAIISNCVIVNNSASRSGGGVYRTASIYNCILERNYATYHAGGAYACTLYDCMIISNFASASGGVMTSTLRNCTLRGNSSAYSAGGAGASSALYNCLVVGNYTLYYGGGTSDSTLYNCTVVGNKSGSQGGGVHSSATVARTVYNSIVYFNEASDGVSSNWYGTNTGNAFINSCTSSNRPGWADGNITADPMFIDRGSGECGTNYVAGNYRLNPDSPCVNTGTNLSWMSDSSNLASKDLDGRARKRYRTVDMGAYERINEGTAYDIR